MDVSSAESLHTMAFALTRQERKAHDKEHGLK